MPLSHPRFEHLGLALRGLSVAALVPTVSAQTLDPKLYAEMQWRQIGPPRAGRARFREFPASPMSFVQASLFDSAPLSGLDQCMSAASSGSLAPFPDPER